MFQYCEMDTDSAYIALAGDSIDDRLLAGNLSGGEVNLAYELLNIQQSIDGLMSILSLFIIHVALVHVRIE